MIVLEVETEPTFVKGPARVLFDTPLRERSPGDPNRYGVSSDGQKFLVIVNPPAGEATSSELELRLILNWGEELEARVPTR